MQTIQLHSRSIRNQVGCIINDRGNSRLSLACRSSGFCLGLAYLLQVTILPVIHYRMHSGEHSHHSVHEPTSDSDDHHTELAHSDDSNSFLVNGATADHHSSHDSQSCSVCSSIHEAIYASYDCPSLMNLFPGQPRTHAPDEPCLLTQFSPISPRAPPAILA